VFAPPLELGRVERRDRAIADALDADGVGLGEASPHLERLSRRGSTGRQRPARGRSRCARPSRGRRRARRHHLGCRRCTANARAEHSAPSEALERPIARLAPLGSTCSSRARSGRGIGAACAARGSPRGPRSEDRRCPGLGATRGLSPLLGDDPDALALAVLLATAYPALAQQLLAHPEDARELAAESHVAHAHSRGLPRAAGSRALRRRARGAASRLRIVARRERARIALRELLPRAQGGVDVDTTAEELACARRRDHRGRARGGRGLGDAALRSPRRRAGQSSGFVVLGMGKLGGLELNPGSDVDLVYFYDTDDGGIVPPGADEPSPEAVSLHEYWTRVARRLTATLEEPTSDGFVWRVDLRLRPEGGRGPLVNSVAAALRYYESFGRLWERAALLRARPSQAISRSASASCTSCLRSCGARPSTHRSPTRWPRSSSARASSCRRTPHAI
jgi:hypothetical protein